MNSEANCAFITVSGVAAIVLFIGAIVTMKRRMSKEVITDDYGNIWSKFCMYCGAKIVITRPGDARCPRGCWDE